jgi:hypothetical protein
MTVKPTWVHYGVLILSFIPLLVKALSYLSIGGYAPVAVFCLFVGFILWSIKAGPKAEKRGIKIWSVAIVLWGVVRISLMVLFLVAPLSEAHVQSQFTVWYVLTSLFHILLGLYLFRQAGLRFRAA